MAEYKGKEVELNKPFRLSGNNESKKFGVYVKNLDTDDIIFVKFGDSNFDFD